MNINTNQPFADSKMKLKYTITPFLITIIFLTVLGMETIKVRALNKELYPDCDQYNHICGPINTSFEDQINLALRNHAVKIIIVTSEGGDHYIAIRIAKILNNRAIKLEIQGVCFSACAQDLVLGVNHVHLREDSIISMHQSGSFMHEMASEHFSNNKAYVEHTKAIMQTEKLFFDILGIDKNALFLPARVLEYKCYNSKIYKRKGDMLIKLVPTNDWFVPNVKVLTTWRNRTGLSGGIISGEDFLQRFNNYPRLLRQNSFVYSDKTKVDDTRNYVKSIKKCGD